MQRTDTSEEAARVQVEAWRRLGAGGRIAIMLEMCEQAAEASREGIRRRHPEYDDAQVHDAFLVLLWGEELFRRACPGRRVWTP